MYDCQDWLNKQGFQKLNMAGEWETRYKISVKSEDQGINPLQGEGAKIEPKPALLYFQPWRKEYMGSWAITHVVFRAKEQRTIINHCATKKQ